MDKDNELLEYSVVYTDRALNHMSKRFQTVMCEISTILKGVYSAAGVAIVPGSGTFAMEAVARQIAGDKRCMVLRNGWFSYRWTQILEQCGISSSVLVCKAYATESSPHPHYAPMPIDMLCEKITSYRPEVFFAPHVETSAGMILPDNYLRRIGDAVRAVGGVFVLDCIASGAMWVDMEECMVDFLITAPQKGWTGTPCAGVVLMNQRAQKMVTSSQSSSFACDLKKWFEIMQRYEAGGHAYHATMPTDGLQTFRDVMKEAQEHGFDYLKKQQKQLGEAIRSLCAQHWKSLVPQEFAAPSVVVCYTDSFEEHKGIVFAKHGIQIAAGVPLRCDEKEAFQTFRIGLFGLDKLIHLQRTIENFDAVLRKLKPTNNESTA